MLGIMVIFFIYNDWKRFRLKKIIFFLLFLAGFNALQMLELVFGYMYTNIFFNKLIFFNSINRIISAPLELFISIFSINYLLLYTFWENSIKIKKKGMVIFFAVTLGLVLLYVLLASDFQPFSATKQLHTIPYYTTVIIFSILILIIYSNFKLKKEVNNSNWIILIISGLLFAGQVRIFFTESPGLNTFYKIYVVYIIPVINIMAIVNHKLFNWHSIKGINNKKLNNIDYSLREGANLYKLTNREVEISELIINGKSNDEIKKALFISHHTVKNHIYVIYKKVGVTSRTQLINALMAKNE